MSDVEVLPRFSEKLANLFGKNRLDEECDDDVSLVDEFERSGDDECTDSECLQILNFSNSEMAANVYFIFKMLINFLNQLIRLQNLGHKQLRFE